ncbi:MAG TPA: hypothetical protein VEO19_04445 [Terriglobia bacterium]|nr:hypothetical protein [Terriglobia bacterium]
MRKLSMLATVSTLVLAGGLAWGQKTRLNPRRPSPVVSFDNSDASVNPLATTLSGMSATPATIQFTANNPGSAVAGNSSATVSWKISGGASGKTWTLSVYANSATFSGCSTVPASSVGVSCTSASVTGTGATASCQAGGPFTLPTTAPGQQVASGNEGNSSSHTFTVVLNYQITDSWEYIANTCPLTITYTVNAP